MNIINKYLNGNTIVTLHSDGTKIMECDGESKIDFPTSIDIKITNWCDNKICSAYCHEKSNTDGKHGDLERALEVLSRLPSGVELACLEEKTKVFTQNGFINIGDISVGDYVLDENGNPQKVVQRIESKKECIRIIGNRGFDVVCTPDHLFKTKNGLQKAKFLINEELFIASRSNKSVSSCIDLFDYANNNSRVDGIKGGNIGGYLVDNGSKVKLNQSAMPVNRFIDFDDRLFFLYGLVVAEGSSKGISLHKKEMNLANKAIDIYCSKTGFKKSAIMPNGKNGINVEFLQPKVFQSIFLEHMKVGSGARNKSIEFLFGRNKEEIRMALYGMFLGDGCFRKNARKGKNYFSLSYKTASEKLAYQLNYILYTVFGVSSTIHEGMNKKRKIDGRTLNPTNYFSVVTYGKENIDKLFPFHFKGDKEYEAVGTSKYSCTKPLNLKIKKIEDVGIKNVVDITLENGSSHLFTLSHGVVTHNCGGGDPISHPDIKTFLLGLKKQGLIANITVNSVHLKRHKEFLTYCVQNDLIKGLGISYTGYGLAEMKYFCDLTDNVVVHVIAGVNELNCLGDIKTFCKKVLILGYKHFGNGKGFYSKEVEDKLYKWLIHLPKYFGELTISFDNLAIEQLKLERFFPKSEWDKFYMGADGSHTMYLDCTKKEFARSSTSSERFPFKDDVFDMFSVIRV